MALDTVKLFTPARSLWDLGTQLGEHVLNAKTMADIIGDHLQTIPNLADQQRAVPCLTSLRDKLASLEAMEEALQLAHGLQE
jgi:hypothetical protein